MKLLRLKKGEVIREGDSCNSVGEIKLSSLVGAKTSDDTTYYRIDDWNEIAKCGRPTIKDRDVYGEVQWATTSGACLCAREVDMFSARIYGQVTHWRRIVLPSNAEEDIFIDGDRVIFGPEGLLEVGCKIVSKGTMEKIVERWQAKQKEETNGPI